MSRPWTEAELKVSLGKLSEEIWLSTYPLRKESVLCHAILSLGQLAKISKCLLGMRCS